MVSLFFYYQGSPVEQAKPNSSELLRYSGIHHIDKEDLADLHKEYSDIIPQYDKYAYMTFAEWGYAVEEGLCELMLRGLVKKSIFRGGKVIAYKFLWVGPKWSAADRRRITP